MFNDIPFRLPGVNLHGMMAMAKSNFSIFLSNFTTGAYQSGGILIAGFLLTPVPLGLFGILDKLISMVNNGFAVVFRAIFPKVAYLTKYDPDKIPKIFRKYYIAFGMVITTGVLLFVLWGGEAIALVSDGLQEQELGDYIPLLAVIPYLVCVNVPISMLMVSLDLKNHYLIYNVFLTGSFLLLSVFLGQSLAIKGLFISHILAQFLAFSIFTAILTKRGTRII